jgi:hypothetical protein
MLLFCMYSMVTGCLIIGLTFIEFSFIYNQKLSSNVIIQLMIEWVNLKIRVIRKNLKLNDMLEVDTFFNEIYQMLKKNKKSNMIWRK